LTIAAHPDVLAQIRLLGFELLEVVLVLLQLRLHLAQPVDVVLPVLK
jgi:hypothetical protein